MTMMMMMLLLQSVEYMGVVSCDYNLSLNSVKSVGRVRSNKEWIVITVQ